MPEPDGGAHRDFDAAAANLRAHLAPMLQELCAQNIDDLVNARYAKFRAMGEHQNVPAS